MRSKKISLKLYMPQTIKLRWESGRCKVVVVNGYGCCSSFSIIVVRRPNYAMCFPLCYYRFIKYYNTIMDFLFLYSLKCNRFRRGSVEKDFRNKVLSIFFKISQLH